MAAIPLSRDVTAAGEYSDCPDSSSRSPLGNSGPGSSVGLMAERLPPTERSFGRRCPCVFVMMPAEQDSRWWSTRCHSSESFQLTFYRRLRSAVVLGLCKKCAFLMESTAGCGATCYAGGPRRDACFYPRFMWISLWSSDTGQDAFLEDLGFCQIAQFLGNKSKMLFFIEKRHVKCKESVNLRKGVFQIHGIIVD